MTKKLFILGLTILLSLPGYTQQDAEIPRTVLAFYKADDEEQGLKSHPLHRFLEMPFNHLGLQLVFWDINSGLPDLKQFPPIRGIVSWYYEKDVNQPEAYLKWMIERLQEGKKVLFINNIGAFSDEHKRPVNPKVLNKFLNLLGLNYEENWVTLDATAQLFGDLDMFSFEEGGITHPDGVDEFSWIEKEIAPSLSVRMLDKSVPVVTFNEHGGMIHAKYFIKINYETNIARWICNPFMIISKIFDTSKTPKPDTTTLNGRRIYFSHIDGDGWQSMSLVGRKRGEEFTKTCADMILEKAILPFPDLPVTVAPIAANLDPKWRGRERDQETARRLFELPQVEVASHTYSHPFEWGYYDNDNPAVNELRDFGKDGMKKDGHENLKHDYDVPRAYFDNGFDVKNEILGSLDFIEKFAPPHKKPRLIQWSGNCMPYPHVMDILMSREGCRNINGGDSRFDNDYPSYSSVCPVGRHVGNYMQIYAVNSNENTYTDGWKNKYFAYKYLKKTLAKTESPLRVKAINLYYHMYSGENLASLSALLGNLEYVKQQEIIPIETYAYAGIGNGFYSIRFTSLGDGGIKVLDRGELNTIRFDRSSDQIVDLSKSQGVLGFRAYQGSLYIALEPLVESPVIYLSDLDHATFADPILETTYLHSSRWRISEISRASPTETTFKAYGYGAPEMIWVVPQPGLYTVKIGSKNPEQMNVKVGNDGLLTIKTNIRNVLAPLDFNISLERNKNEA